jgi:hypothetical protein
MCQLFVNGPFRFIGAVTAFRALRHTTATWTLMDPPQLSLPKYGRF